MSLILTDNKASQKARQDLPEDPKTEDRRRQLNTLIALSDRFGDSLARELG